MRGAISLLPRTFSCIVVNLCNVLYTVSTQQYISTVIKYIQSGHIIATCFDLNGHLQANKEHF